MRLVYQWFVALFVLVVAAGCAQTPQAEPTEEGFKIQDAASVKEAVERIRAALEERSLRIVLVVDHGANAANVDLELRPTQLIIFGNPNVGTQLMQQSQTVGIDLPQKLLVWEDEDGAVKLAFNEPEYLARRHGIEGLDELFGNIGNLLGQFGASEIDASLPEDAGTENGLIMLQSNQSVEDTVAALQSALEEGGFLVPLMLDHSANAASVDLELRPTQLIVFGNPNVGTQLMQQSQSIGLDLPLKFLIWEDENGAVNIAYNDPRFLAQRHGITGMDELLTNMANGLSNLAEAAANPQS